MNEGTNPADEFRQHRHEFILHYYDMAVKDLERHLQVGWQSISFAAGVIAVLSAGQQGYLPVPIAVAAALSISFWGVQTILDADLWARRAIAFLANVEAVYFYHDDRRVFNPYAGSHPPLKILDSLQSQLVAAGVFVVLTMMYLAWSLSQHVHNFLLAGNSLSQVTRVKFSFWLAPLFFFLFLLRQSVKMRRDRISDYLKFVTNCPGPGMVKNRDKWRGVDLKGDVTLSDVVSGEEIQRPVREDLELKLKRWNKLFRVAQLASILFAIGLGTLIVFERCLLH